MKRITLLTCAALAVAWWPTLMSAQPVHEEKSPKADFHFSQALVVGTETLKPGDYGFQCKMIDGKHFLVVTSAEDGKELARVPCTGRELEKKAGQSEIRSVTEPNGSRRLTALRVKGETIEHRVSAD